MRVIKKKVGHNIIANNANWTFQGIEKIFRNIFPRLCRCILKVIKSH